MLVTPGPGREPANSDWLRCDVIIRFPIAPFTSTTRSPRQAPCLIKPLLNIIHDIALVGHPYREEIISKRTQRAPLSGPSSPRFDVTGAGEWQASREPAST
jgi:hypothetical protein